MPFTPVIPASGLTGWGFLNASLASQSETFNKSPDIARDVEYFLENFEKVETLDEFMSDRRILKVALGAFGLSDEIDKGAFVRKILAEGTSDSSAFAVRLNNPNYLKLAKAIAPSERGTLTLDGVTGNDIAEKYKVNTFEAQVGTVDNSMRLSLNFRREISELVQEDISQNAGWFKAMASIPMRTVLEGAFNLPEGFSQLDLDKQKDLLSEKANRLFGSKSIEVFSDPENVETAIRRFLLREQIEQGPSISTPGYSALTLLSGGLGSAGLANLLISNG